MSAANCRACAARPLSLVLDLGLMPPARRFLTPELAALPEPLHPLRLLRCDACGILQLDGATVEPLAALRERPTAEFEVPDLLALHDRLDCDLICHETPYYFSLAQISDLLRKDGFELIDVVPQLDTLRLTVQRRGGSPPATPAVDAAIARERAAGLDGAQAWADFAMLVEQARDLLCSELQEWFYQNKKVAAYSVGGRGMTTLAYCGGPALQLPCLIDEDVLLHGLLTPGHRLPIVGPERLAHEHFDVLLLLGRDFDPAGNGPLHDFWRSGGRILMPTPKPHYADAPRPVLLHSAPALSFADFG